MLAVQLASMGLAGSDHLHHRHFVEAAEVYRYNFVQMLNQDMVDEGAAWDHQAGRELWSQIPAFEYQPPTLPAVLDHYRLSMLLLVLWNLVLLALTPIAISSMKVG